MLKILLEWVVASGTGAFCGVMVVAAVDGSDAMTRLRSKLLV